MVDASVVVKWAVNEVLSTEARQLLVAEHDLIAPDILQIEAANALLKKVRRRELTVASALHGIETYLGVLSFVPSTEAYEGAIALALASGCSTYDGVYVVSGELVDCPLITADERLRRTLGRQYEDRVLMLGNSLV